MFLSIIIPSYNTKEYLEDCIRSIWEETKEIEYEVIVVDNGSKYNIKSQIEKIRYICQEKSLGHKRHPESASRRTKDPIRILEDKEILRCTQNDERVEEKLNIKLIQNKRNLGFAKACNQGIEKAKGDYILFLNSDTVILKKAIEKALELIKERKEIDILGCKLLNKNGSLQPSAGFFPKLRQIFYTMFFLDDLPLLNLFLKPYHQQRKAFYTREQEVDWVTGAFLLTRREVVEKIGGFDEDYFMYAEEVDFCFRAKKLGSKVFYTPGAKVIHYKEASPRIHSPKAILAEFKGLKIFFRKHKRCWEMPILDFLLKTGSLLRILIFGILLGNEEKKKIYWQAEKLV